MRGTLIGGGILAAMVALYAVVYGWAGWAL